MGTQVQTDYNGDPSSLTTNCYDNELSRSNSLGSYGAGARSYQLDPYGAMMIPPYQMSQSTFYNDTVYEMYINWSYIVIYAIIMLISLLGNLLFVAMVVQGRNLVSIGGQPFTWMLLGMALRDLAVTLFVIPIVIYSEALNNFRWFGSQFLCKFYLFMHTVTMADHAYLIFFLVLLLLIWFHKQTLFERYDAETQSQLMESTHSTARVSSVMSTAFGSGQSQRSNMHKWAVPLALVIGLALGIPVASLAYAAYNQMTGLTTCALWDIRQYPFFGAHFYASAYPYGNFNNDNTLNNDINQLYNWRPWGSGFYNRSTAYTVLAKYYTEVVIQVLAFILPLILLLATVFYMLLQARRYDLRQDQTRIGDGVHQQAHMTTRIRVRQYALLVFLLFVVFVLTRIAYNVYSMIKIVEGGSVGSRYQSSNAAASHLVYRGSANYYYRPYKTDMWINLIIFLAVAIHPFLYFFIVSDYRAGLNRVGQLCYKTSYQIDEEEEIRRQRKLRQYPMAGSQLSVQSRGSGPIRNAGTASTLPLLNKSYDAQIVGPNGVSISNHGTIVRNGGNSHNVDQYHMQQNSAQYIPYQGNPGATSTLNSSQRQMQSPIPDSGIVDASFDSPMSPNSHLPPSFEYGGMKYIDTARIGPKIGYSPEKTPPRTPETPRFDDKPFTYPMNVGPTCDVELREMSPIMPRRTNTSNPPPSQHMGYNGSSAPVNPQVVGPTKIIHSTSIESHSTTTTKTAFDGNKSRTPIINRQEGIRNESRVNFNTPDLPEIMDSVENLSESPSSRRKMNVPITLTSSSTMSPQNQFSPDSMISSFRDRSIGSQHNIQNSTRHLSDNHNKLSSSNSTSSPNSASHLVEELIHARPAADVDSLVNKVSPDSSSNSLPRHVSTIHSLQTKESVTSTYPSNV